MTTEVLIAGAGPTGLVLALWLTVQGISVRIVDKHAGPGEQSRATALQARTLELYDQLGLGETIANEGYKARGMRMWSGGQELTHVPIGDIGANLSPYPFLLIYPQDLHERFLVDQLAQRGVHVERNTELRAFTQDEHGVTATVRANGSDSTVSAKFLAGCDGASSKVRNAVGGSFTGGTYSHLFYVADVEVEGTEFDKEINVVLEGPDFLLVMPYGKPGTLRLVGVISDVGPNDAAAPREFSDIQQEPLTAVGIHVRKVNWFSTYHVHHRVTDTFRYGRVFLLGDAAHVHSPAGGQGLNTGLGDAVNMAWKFAAVLQGRAKDNVLDTINAERRTFALQLVNTTDKAFSFITARGRLAEFTRVHLAPYFIKTLYQWEPVGRVLFRTVSQIEIRYEHSPLSVGKAGSVNSGDRLPYVAFDGGSNFDLLRSVQWKLHVYGTASEEIREWSAKTKVVLTEFPFDKAFADAGFAENALYLLRPDSYVGLATTDATEKAIETYFAEIGISL